MNNRAVCSSGTSDCHTVREEMSAQIWVFMTLFPKTGELLPFLD